MSTTDERMPGLQRERSGESVCECFHHIERLRGNKRQVKHQHSAKENKLIELYGMFSLILKHFLTTVFRKKA